MRVGSPTGELLGSTEKISKLDIDIWEELKKLRTAWEKGGKKGPRPSQRTVRELFTPEYVISIDPIEGKRDVYFVIRNPEAKEGEILIKLDNLTFQNAYEPL